MTDAILLENGLLTFRDLPKGVNIYTTYDGKLWGNMNSYFSTTEEEKNEIIIKDKKISDSLKTKLTFVCTTPSEDTIEFLNNESIASLQFSKRNDDYNYISVRCNGLIAKRQNFPYEVVYALSDCPVLTIIPKESDLVISAHLGAPQVFQGLHLKIINFARSVDSRINWENSLSYLGPYICQDHYSISEEKYLLYKNNFRNPALFEKYIRKGQHPIFKGNRYFFDFVGLFKEEVRQLGLNSIIETGVCTYEASLQGNLFSHELAQEVDEKMKLASSTEKNKYYGGYNVVIGISS